MNKPEIFYRAVRGLMMLNDGSHDLKGNIRILLGKDTEHEGGFLRPDEWVDLEALHEAAEKISKILDDLAGSQGTLMDVAKDYGVEENCINYNLEFDEACPPVRPRGLRFVKS